jgi:hypothetical protein
MEDHAAIVAERDNLAQQVGGGATHLSILCKPCSSCHVEEPQYRWHTNRESGREYMVHGRGCYCMKSLVCRKCGGRGHGAGLGCAADCFCAGNLCMFLAHC